MESWRKYINEEAPAITKMHSQISDYKKRGCKWNYETSKGMKVFFDVTSFSHENQTFFGKMIIAGNAIQKALKGQIKGALGASNHVGFIFSDGSIFHATSDETGVSFQPSYPDIEQNPHQYVIVDLGGDEQKLKQVCQSILNELKEQNVDASKAYDWKGIKRQIPVIGKLLAHLKTAKEENEYSFYCSELVANALVRVGYMTAEQLVARVLSEQLGQADEISPTELYELIAPKSNVIGVVCEIEPQQQQPEQQPQAQQQPQTRTVKPERFFESKK